MSDRNLLEDFWTLTRLINDVSLDYAPELQQTLAEMKAYWGAPDAREPWGVCVLLVRTWPGTEATRKEVLVIHGSKGIGLPGGKPNKGETPLAAGCRELLEETGFSASWRSLELDSNLPLLADNGVPTYLLVEARSTSMSPPLWYAIDEGFESDEGVTYWAHPRVLVGKHARFPEYNRKILNRMGLL